MTVYCSLYIRSNSHSELPSGFLRRRKKMNLEFVDNDSPERRAHIERMRKIPGFENTQPFRYRWWLSSADFVQGYDLYEHLMWIFDRVQPDYLLSQLGDAGFEYGLSVYWEGNGTGGGPLITPQIAEQLTRHKVGLQIGFYLEQES